MRQKDERKLVKPAHMGDPEGWRAQASGYPKCRWAWLRLAIVAGIMLLQSARANVSPLNASDAPEGTAFILSQEEKKCLLFATRETLSKFKRDQEVLHLEFKDVPPRLIQPQKRYIIITIFSPGKPLIFTTAKKESLLSSVLDAGTSLANTTWAMGYNTKALETALIKIDVALKQDLVWPRKEGSPALLFELGVDGLYLEDKDQVYFLPPGLAILNGINSKGAFADELGHTYRRPPDQWDKEKTRLYKFRVLSFMEASSAGEVVDLYRENVPISEVNLKGREKALETAAHRLLQFQKKDGSFHFAFDPFTGVFDDSRYGIVPHCEAALALLDLYRTTRNRTYLDAADKALDYLKKHISPQGEDKFRYIIWEDLAELDASAMAAASFATFQELSRKNRYRRELLALGDFLLLMLQQDGSFKTSYKADEKASESPRAWNAPAQSLLALVRIYKTSGEERFLQGARRAARFLIEDRERVWGLAGPPPDAFFVIALEELYSLTPQKEYAEYAQKMARGIMEEQYTEANPPYPDYVGGFSGGEVPLTSPAAFRLTGLVAAKRLANLAGQPDAHIQTAILRTVKFLLTQQYRDQNTYYLASPEEARGGFRAGPADGIIHLVTLERAIRGLRGSLDE